MTLAHAIEKSGKPFLLALVPPLDEELYSKALAEMRAVEASYDPESQTSNIPVYAGTSQTFVTTGTGPGGFADSDSKASDG